MHTSLFDILPLVILEDTDIWLSGLKHRDKFKHVILRFKSMSNPVLFAISYNLWTSHHNFWSLRWCNKVRYNCANRRILSRDEGYCISYLTVSLVWYFWSLNSSLFPKYTNKSEYTTQLTPQLLKHSKLCKSLQQLSQNEKSTIPYFKEKIPDSDKKDHIERDVLTFPWPQPYWLCYPYMTGISYIYLPSQNFFI